MTSGRKPISLGLPDSRRSEAPRGVSEGTESFSGDASNRTSGYSHLAQPAAPPYADPHVRWCGRGGRVIAPPIPIVWVLSQRVPVWPLDPLLQLSVILGRIKMTARLSDQTIFTHLPSFKAADADPLPRAAWSGICAD